MRVTTGDRVTPADVREVEEKNRKIEERQTASRKQLSDLEPELQRMGLDFKLDPHYAFATIRMK